MNEETHTDVIIPTDLLNPKAHRKRVIALLRDMVHDKKEIISEEVDSIKCIRSNLHAHQDCLVAEQIALNALQQELTTWEDPKHEESDRDPSKIP